MKNVLISFMHGQVGDPSLSGGKAFALMLKQKMRTCQAEQAILIVPEVLATYTEAFSKTYHLNALILHYNICNINSAQEASVKLNTLLGFIETAYPNVRYHYLSPEGPEIIRKTFARLVKDGTFRGQLVDNEEDKRLCDSKLAETVEAAETLEHTLEETEHRFFEDLVTRIGLRGQDPAFRRALVMAQRLAPYRQPILLQGETGTGKELFARLIHQLSAQSPGPFVAVNCATLPESLAESILMGHSKGAFTGAQSSQKGKFEQAHEGTLFLDEIAEMSLNVQAKLLRVIEDGFVDAIGSQKQQYVNIAIIGATHRDLKEAVLKGTFRSDLYYRLKIGCITLPPLRERRSDIRPIAIHLLARFNNVFGKTCTLSEDALQALSEYPWAGNVRELRNVIQRSSMLCEHSEITASDLQIDPLAQAAEPPSNVLPAFEDGFILNDYIRDIRRQIIQDALRKTNGKQSEAAKLLGISPQAVSSYTKEVQGGSGV